MELSGLSPATLSASRAAETGQEAATQVLKKALDIETTQAAQFAQMVAMQAGLGRGMDTSA